MDGRAWGDGDVLGKGCWVESWDLCSSLPVGASGGVGGPWVPGVGCSVATRGLSSEPLVYIGGRQGIGEGWPPGRGGLCALGSFWLCMDGRTDGDVGGSRGIGSGGVLRLSSVRVSGGVGGKGPGIVSLISGKWELTSI